MQEIMSKVVLNPTHASIELGYSKELCNTLMHNFYKDQFKQYIDNITEHVDSNDQLLMYSVAHKLVGSAGYAGAMRVRIVSDKMQKAVP